MQDYTVIENAVRERILAHFSDILSEDVCYIADSDRLFRELIRNKSTYGCHIDLGVPPGRLSGGESFKGQHWIWMVVGLFVIHYNEDLETNIRSVINKLPALFHEDRRLGGLVPNAVLTGIDSPQIVTVNDIPYYFLAFSIEIWDRYV